MVLLALTVSCVGPTLEVAELDEDDAGALDAGVLDGGDAGTRRRDASFADRDDLQEERYLCRDERDCVFNFVRDHCNVQFAVCVQCFDDRQCASGRCAESEGLCRGKDDPGPSP